LEGGQRVLSRTAALSGATADAPVSALRLAGRGITRPIQELVDVAPQFARLREAAPGFATTEGRAIRREARQGVHAADRANTNTIREFARATERTGVSLDEQAAARALVTGEAATLRQLEQRAGLAPNQFYDVAVPRKLDESHLTREGYDIAKAHLDGTLDPETTARINEYADVMRREAGTATDEAVAGLGRRRGLSEEYLTSNEPLSIEVERAAREGYNVNLDAPSTYAARWRSPMIQAQRVQEHLQGLEDARRTAAEDAGIAYVPAERHLFPSMSLKSNLTLGAYPRRPHAATLELVYDLFPRLKERQRQQAGTLSGGEQQMLAVARALTARPRLLMLDEPTTGLAPKIAQIAFEALEGLKNEGMTLLIAEQQVPLALSVADRGYVLENGHIRLSGTSEELDQNPEVRRAYLGAV
jgi:branched-chain amino acid transport system ATP-binding protein